MANKPKKNRQLNWRVIRDSYVMRNDMPSLNKVAREFKIDSGQISRRSQREKWDQLRKRYWDKVSAKVQQKSVTTTAFNRAKALKIVESSVGMTVEILADTQKKIRKGKIPKVKYKDLIGSLDKQLRLYELLVGRPDSRPGGGVSFEEFVKDLMKKRIKEHKQIEADDRGEATKKVKARVNNDKKI